MAKKQQSSEDAKRTLVHYFKHLAAHAGLYWHDDYQAEIEGAIDDIIDAAVNEAVNRVLRSEMLLLE